VADHQSGHLDRISGASLHHRDPAMNFTGLRDVSLQHRGHDNDRAWRLFEFQIRVDGANNIPRMLPARDESWLAR
jgi:hypothetical protein